MTYNDMPVIIPLLATGYLLTIYLLLMLAQRTTKTSRYMAADSFTDTYVPYVQTKSVLKIDDMERWSRKEVSERRAVSSSKTAPLTLAASPPQKVQEAGSVP